MFAKFGPARVEIGPESADIGRFPPEVGATGARLGANSGPTNLGELRVALEIA